MILSIGKQNKSVIMEARIVATLKGGSGVMDLEDDKGI